VGSVYAKVAGDSVIERSLLSSARLADVAHLLGTRIHECVDQEAAHVFKIHLEDVEREVEGARVDGRSDAAPANGRSSRPPTRIRLRA
jgi:hypothetical protein